MSRLSWAPVDSAEAKELRDREAPDDEPNGAEHVPAAEPLEHSAACRDGWLGEDAQGRPAPCLVCRPHLTPTRPCRVCGVARSACADQVDQRHGRCCYDCVHRTEGANEQTFSNATGQRGDRP